LYRSILYGRIAHGLATVINIVGRLRRRHRGLMMTLIQVVAGSVMGVRLHVGGKRVGWSVWDHKAVRDFILLVRFRRNSEV
jgi:hypothetical protein